MWCMFTSLRLTTLSTDLLRFRSWIFCMVHMFRQNIDRKVVIRSTCRKLSLTMMYWKKRWEPEKEGVFCSKFWLFFYILWIHLQFFSPENFMDRMPIIWYFMYLCITHTHIYIYRVLRVMFLTNRPATFFPPSIFWQICVEMTIRFFRPFSAEAQVVFWSLQEARWPGRWTFRVFPKQVWMAAKICWKTTQTLECPAAGCGFVTPHLGWHAVDASMTTLHMIVWVGILIHRSQPGNSRLKLLISTAWLLIVTKLLRQKLVKSWWS